MKIFITGGHVTPAIALIEEIRKSHKDWDIVFVGRKHAIAGEKEVSAEYRVISSMGIRFLPLFTGRSNNVLKVLLGFFQAVWFILKERPSAIVSFGGYVAPPVVIAGWLLGVPSLTHEQTRTLGAANKTMLPFVKKICVSYEEVIDHYHLPKEKTVITGLPIRKELFIPPTKPLFSFSPTYPLLYIAGGATGSEFINTTIFSLLPPLTKRYTLVHQTGYTMYPVALEKLSLLPTSQQSRYHPLPYVTGQDLAWIYTHTKLYIGRSGVNTVGELAALGKVAIFIPYPWSESNEQDKNAKVLKDAGSAVVIDQSRLHDELLTTIITTFARYESLHKHAIKFARTVPLDGAVQLLNQLQKLIS